MRKPARVVSTKPLPTNFPDIPGVRHSSPADCDWQANCDTLLFFWFWAQSSPTPRNPKH